MVFFDNNSTNNTVVVGQQISLTNMVMGVSTNAVTGYQSSNYSRDLSYNNNSSLRLPIGKILCFYIPST